MGRRKIGKPRRERRAAADYSLDQLEPPGALYEEWFQVEEGMDTSAAAKDARVSADALDLMERLARLAKPYAGRVPKAAVMLDMALDSGFLPLRQGDGGIMVPLDEAASMFAAGSVNPEQVRESVHCLHAVGALLMESVEETVIGRLVARRPKHPGEPWEFVDDEPGDAGPKTCMPNGAVADLTAEEFAAFAYLRSCDAAGDEVTAEHFCERISRDGDVERAKKLFAAVAASGWLEVKGCSACPSGHLCTRDTIGETSDTAHR
ncbi:hypothetical protein [Streptomyces cyaneofuscatus]|uniref:hypothetical protein n=1 Tax=Streptomyces cyaneofuscatus TaxID=66883 RepID=UPI0036658E73